MAPFKSVKKPQWVFPKRKGYKPRRKYVSKPSKKFTKMVQKIIHSDAETKYVQLNSGFQSFNSGINVAADVLQVVPGMARGTGDANRIGDQIRFQKMVLKGHMIMSTNYQDLNSSRIGVRLMIVQPKLYSQITAVQTNLGWLTSLIKKGSTTGNFTGSIQDLYSDINRDVVTVYYDKVYYLDMPAIISTAGTTSVNTQVAEQLRTTTRFFSKTFNLKNKLIKYDDTISPNDPTNYAPVLLVGYAHLNGSAADVANTQLGLQFCNNVYYEDI